MSCDESKVRILVIKHGALGDIIQGLDAFASLRAGNPYAHITLMTSPGFLSIARLMPWFDDIIVDPRAGLFNFFALLSIRRYLRQDWSVVVDMQCSSRTRCYFSYCVKPNTCWIGVAPGCSSPLPDLTGVNNRERMIKTAEIAGGISQSIDMAWLKTGLIDIKDELLIDPMAAYAVLVPGCSLAKPQKRWPSESFAAVGANLLARGLKVYVVGTKEDRVAVSGVLTHSPSIVDLSEKTSLPVLAKLFQGASYVIGNDTGPVFLAAKAGAKTLMIMGPDTDPEMSAPSGRACTWLQGKPISDVSVRSALNSLSKLN